MDGNRWSGWQGQTFSPTFQKPLAPAPDQPSKTVDGKGPYRQTDNTFNTSGTISSHTFKASVLKGVDCRFHYRMMTLTHRCKNRFPCTDDVGLVQSALPRQSIVGQQCIKQKAVGVALETARKTAGMWLPSDDDGW